MRLKLERDASQGGRTFGKLYSPDGYKICWTLEDEIREIPGKPVAEWKIKSATAIPAGSYRIVLENSAKFGPDTMTLLNVPGFQYIRIHAGNTTADTEGCLLVGMKITPVGIEGGTSRPALTLLKSMVKNWIDSGKEVWIDIINPVTIA